MKVYPVKLLCQLLGVSRSGCYGYLRRQDRDPDPEHEETLGLVKDLAEASDNTYGSRRMARALRALGYRVGRYQARRLMREAGVWVRYRRCYRTTTNSNYRQAVFENRLERNFAVDAPDHIYAGDITYVCKRPANCIFRRPGWLGEDHPWFNRPRVEHVGRWNPAQTVACPVAGSGVGLRGR